jgi:hypothetical protein
MGVMGEGRITIPHIAGIPHISTWDGHEGYTQQFGEEGIADTEVL